MKAVLLAGLLLLVVLAAPLGAAAQSGDKPAITLTNQYIVNRYGYAILNETIKYNNSGVSSLGIPTMQLGVPQNISSRLVGDYALVGDGYSLATSTSNGLLLFSISSQKTLQPKSVSSFSLKAVVRDISVLNKTAPSILVLEYPSVNLQVDSFNFMLQMPASTLITPVPQSWSSSQNQSRTTYKTAFTGFGPQTPLVFLGALQPGTSIDFHPIHVYSASRTLTAASDGSPLVQDSVTLSNTGTSDLTSLQLAMLNNSAKVTVIPSMVPPLLNPTPVRLTSGAIDLTKTPFTTILSGANFTVTILYGLPSKFYTVTGGNIQVTLPLTPPIGAPVDSYALSISLPSGLRATGSQGRVVQNATPVMIGEQTFSYSLTLGWASDRAIPAASVIFVAALLAFAVSRPTLEAETEEGEITGDVSNMIRAFEEKVDLVNRVLQEVPKEDPNNVNKAYFDELRSKLDTFRSKAMQRLNEAKQKSTTQKFSEHLNRIHDIERQADRATRDMLNLYEQYYTRRMRGETFEKLLPSYRKRLDTAMNQLSDQLNLTQREAKTL